MLNLYAKIRDIILKIANIFKTFAESFTCVGMNVVIMLTRSSSKTAEERHPNSLLAVFRSATQTVALFIFSFLISSILNAMHDCPRKYGLTQTIHSRTV